MEDIQYQSPDVQLDIDRVGVRNLKLPLLVLDKVNKVQQTVASVDLGVDLPSHFKGTHMSRFIEIIEEWDKEISYKSVHKLLYAVKTKLEARKSWASFSFPYFISKKSPVSEYKGLVNYECCLTGELDENNHQIFKLELKVPVMTVCPCSKVISDEGAHSQRAIIHISLRMREFSWLEEFIDMAEQAGSSAIYTLLKREDEKFITETAFANPVFVEDVARKVADKLLAYGHIEWFMVEVESMESIHNHNAFARIERILF